jgi:hypothetical protein
LRRGNIGPLRCLLRVRKRGRQVDLRHANQPKSSFLIEKLIRLKMMHKEL